MGYLISADGCQSILQEWLKTYLVYAPKRISGGGKFSDTDCIRYAAVRDWSEMVLEEKSDYSFKEILTPITQILFYFTEERCQEPEASTQEVIVFLRACDIHALQRLDDIYLHNGCVDPYYQKLRERLKLVMIGCSESFSNCFCVDMGSNQSDQYQAAINIRNGVMEWDCKYPLWEAVLQQNSYSECEVTADYVDDNTVHVQVPDNVSLDVMRSKQWAEYDRRCINCGRCNFVCPTCTCFTMQDIFYTDNGRCGERRRVWASCMVDEFTDVAGGGSYRQANGQRMRFKTLHKVYDYKKRFGYHMCVGCGRCDDVCPEYISFSHIINRLESMVQEVQHDEQPK